MAITRMRASLHSLRRLWTLEGKGSADEIDHTLANRYRLLNTAGTLVVLVFCQVVLWLSVYYAVIGF
jgi:hypothetical protein